MTSTSQRGGLTVADNLIAFIEKEALPGTGVDVDAFWKGFDAIVHDLGPKNRALLAERDRTGAARRLLAELAPRPAPPADWPDMLAQALRDDPDLSLALWADRLGLHPGSISRGFRQVFGVTPVAFRLVQRTRQALGALQISAAPLSAIAYDCGFADQAHMSRAVRGLTNATPTALRRAAGMAS